MDGISTARLGAFLVEAKRCTYAGLDDDATISAPIMAGSKQLEYSDHDLSYRDIYFGMAFFVGQEVVTSKQQAIWSMSYGGGISPDVTGRDTVLAVYAFLRKALLAIRADQPFRGPAQFQEGDYRYVNMPEGELSDFHGAERIFVRETPVYSLRYSGGIIR